MKEVGVPRGCPSPYEFWLSQPTYPTLMPKGMQANVLRRGRGAGRGGVASLMMSAFNNAFVVRYWRISGQRSIHLHTPSALWE